MDTTNTLPSLQDVIHHIRELLPSQGPIDVFIHHNTLHAFEHLPFEEAVKEAARVYGAEAFLPEQRYLQEFRNGRITNRDLETALTTLNLKGEALGDYPYPEIVRRFLVASPAVEGFQEVKWLLRESPGSIYHQKIDAPSLLRWVQEQLHTMHRHDALHAINSEAAEGLIDVLRGLPQDSRILESERIVLWAAALLAAAEVWKDPLHTTERAEDNLLDEMCNPILIRFCEEYLDLGFSNQLMPNRSRGMLACFLELVESAHSAVPAWLSSLRRELHLYTTSPAETGSLLSALIDEAIQEPTRESSFLLREALSLRGWAGYISLVEKQPEMLHGQQAEIRPSLVEYLTIRLILRKYALKSPLYQSRCAELLEDNPQLDAIDSLYCFAYHVLLLFTSLGKGDLLLKSCSGAHALISKLHEFNEVKRRELWHLAYENNFYSRSLDALSLHNCAPQQQSESTRAQFIFCIDDREESLRRHVESITDQYQTFGTAGFFGVDAEYTAFSGASSPHCPVIIRPTHAIREVPREGYEAQLSRFQRKQKAWFRISGFVNRGSGSILHNAILSLGGCLSLIPMVLGVLSPRMLRLMEKIFNSQPNVPHDLHELAVESSPTQDGSLPGYTVEEMAARVIGVLRGIGLTKDFAPLILLVGHGSSSRNNPLRSAYDCGACGGRPGRINARAFSLMANRPEVRALVLSQSGISIPDSTAFIGAFHNTCSDQVEYYDLDRVPADLRQALSEVQADLKVATKHNALERCRRFSQAGVRDIEKAAEEALARSYMLAEARPEYGHATNALCIVGPRTYTKGLFLDRRAFLVSYDSKPDSEASVLLGILKAVVPVCGGINLEYLFSAMDNEVYGAGTKLPHNIVSLVGIMNGTSSDLRTGLPTQMIEIHEPVRLLLVIVASKEQIERVVSSDPAIKRAFDGGWIRVVRAAPASTKLEWRLPGGDYRDYVISSDTLSKVCDYRDWFLGKTGHLNFAQLERPTGNSI